MTDHRLPIAISPMSKLPLIGREREFAALQDCLTRTLAGRGGLVLIGGEAGIGKTALADALCREAIEAGALMLIGRCFDLTDTPPYGPWLELFARYRAPEGFPIAPAAFATLGAVSNVASQGTLFQQVRDFFATVTAHTATILLLDDIHWSDPASLDLLRFVARQVADVPLLLLAAYRGDELTRTHPLTPLLPTLVREAAATRLNLHRLRATDVAAFVGSRYTLADDAAARLAAYFYARSEGNPFFLGELARTLEEEDVLSRDGDAWHVSDLTQVRVPALLRHVIDARLTRLGDDAQALLAIAAVIGQEASLAVWQKAAGVTEAAILDVTERAAEARILEETPNGTSVRFVHALIREALYEGIVPSRRRIWHRMIAEVLMAQSRDPDPDAVAYHFRQAGDARAVEWLVRAGKRAERASAWLTAGDRFRAATALIDENNDASGDRGWLLVRQAWLRRFIDPWQGIAALDEAERCAAHAGDRTLAACVPYIRGQLYCRAQKFNLGLTEMEAGCLALDALAGTDHPQIAALHIAGANVHGYNWWGSFVMWLAFAGRYQDARTASVRIAESRPAESRRDEWEPLSNGTGLFGLAHAYAAAGQPTAALDAFTRARRASLARMNYVAALQYVLEGMEHVVLSYFADDRVQRHQLLAEMQEIAAFASGAFQADEPVDLVRLSVLFAEGDWARAREVALAVRAAQGATNHRLLSARILARLARNQGDVDLAWSLVREGVPNGPATMPGNRRYFDTLLFQRLAAALAIDDSDFVSARLWLEAHDRWLAWSESVLGRAESELGWAAHHRAAGEAARALHHATQALHHAAAPRQPLALLAAHRLLGELHTDMGRYDDATMHLTTALPLADACAAPYERALTLVALATLHATVGRREEAAPVIDDARAILIRLGAKPALARADALAARLTVTTPAPPRYPAGLTAREVEVLRLVAAGRTNQEIADILSVSRHTAMNHVAHIMTKTDTDNRAAAATFALRHGLA